ncbi:MAG: DMT family transporter [Methanomicrobium sp.]|nr:DMT family transporter [Methanomicrobium sp.]
MNLNRALFPLLVFLGGCSFGPLSPIVKIAYDDGYSSVSMIFAQYGGGWFCLLILVVIFTLGRMLIGKKSPDNSHGNAFDNSHGNAIDNKPDNTHGNRRDSAKNSAEDNAVAVEEKRLKSRLRGILLLFACGLSIALCSSCNIFALNTISVSLAVLLLFQFIWMGVIIQCIVKRALPSKDTAVSVLMLVIGTVLASGVLIAGTKFALIGVCFGLGSAIFFAVYVFMIGHVAVSIHPVYRSFVVMSMALLSILAIFGMSLAGNASQIDIGLAEYALVIGLFGCAIPMFFFAIGTPKIPTGAATILSSSELPATIICAVIIIHESVTAFQWVGVALVFLGIAYPYLAAAFRENREKSVKV